MFCSKYIMYNYMQADIHCRVFKDANASANGEIRSY